MARRPDRDGDLSGVGLCGHCQLLSACAAVEQACGGEVTEPIRLVRRLLYCGEWISSHALHVNLLHASDFVGFEGVTDLAAAHPPGHPRARP